MGAVLGRTRTLADSGRIDRERWRGIVGERVAARTRPGTIRDGTLTVYVASSVWAQELSLLSTAILDRLREGGVEARALRFRVGEIEPLFDVRAESVERRAAPLPDELSERLARIGDANLRAKVAEAAAYSLGKRDTSATSKPKGTRDPRSDGRGNDPTDRDRTPRRGARKGTV